ncbi:sulfotransferase family protein [Marinobacter sp. SS21]|uniref:sulfotransferase family protein n=1 Tax=Marinobacter sp. SS21 TaxID=2979460 RepID=UPI00232A8178|nr:sulfotransferase [Marinobacter sp. SS21]MDC0664160.1 sulfotransferase [Marinobacter sp. SS21]
MKSFSKVNFFIVGAPKCATTSLHRYLDKHPDIFMSFPKETNFFSSEEILSQNLFYDEKIIKTKSEYEKVFAGAYSSQLLGEASVSYLFYSETARRIKAHNPDAKIIIMIRDPAERAFSHFLMDQRLGYCNYSLESILENRDGLGLYYQQYVLVGLYHDQIKRYIDLFGSENVFVALDEDLAVDGEKLLSSLCDFLGLEFLPELHSYKQHNSYKEPSSFIVAQLYKIGVLRRAFQKLMPKSVSDLIKKRIFSNADKPEMSDFLQDELYSIFNDDILKTGELIGRDLSHWRADT